MILIVEDLNITKPANNMYVHVHNNTQFTVGTLIMRHSNYYLWDVTQEYT